MKIYSMQFAAQRGGGFWLPASGFWLPSSEFWMGWLGWLEGWKVGRWSATAPITQSLRLSRVNPNVFCLIRIACWEADQGREILHSEN